ncbi:MAG: C4-dicarboxylate ABC transporter permease, partial [Rhodoferax sp.]|nr:C4-dicarboxylate ABC transporter permease [Rhodoferax sp.]
MTEALIGFAAMLLLVLMQVPVAFAMALIGVLGLAWIRNWPSAYTLVGSVVQESGFQYLLSVVPLFILMGNLI